MIRVSKTMGAASTYVLLAGLQRGVSFLMLPFITHSISPIEYGAASMLSAAGGLLGAVFAAPLVQLIIRAAARGEDNGPALLRTAGTYCYYVMPIGIALLAGCVALFVPEMLGVAGYLWGIELLAIGFSPAASTFAMWVAQAREDLARFAWLSASSIAATATTKILFVIVFKMGVLGWVLSDLLSAAFSAVLAVCLVRLPQARVDLQQIGYALRFTLPLIPHSVSFWVLLYLSRPAMAAVSTLQQVGLLAFSLNIAQVAGLVLAETNRAALPRYSREVFRAPTRQTINLVRWQLIGAFAVPATVACGVALAGRWIVAEEYWPSFLLTGILLVGQAALGLYLIPMNYLTQTAGITKSSMFASGAGAAAILVGILLLGHDFGAIAIAYATAGGYVLMAMVAVALTFAHKLQIDWKIWLPYWPEVVLAAAALACSVVGLAYPLGSLVAWLYTGGCLILLSASIVLTARRKADCLGAG